MCKTCKVEGCEKKHYGKGYCRKHYQQFRKHGRVLERTRFDKNEIIEYDDYAEIILYDKDNNEVARTMIDLECIESVKKYKWYLKQGGYVCRENANYLHRFIMNPPDDMVVDHINRNKLDNRRENLRICTPHENSFNASIKRNNTSGVPGVSFDKSRNKWVAYITINKERKNLGLYKTKEEAIEARRRAEIEYFGEFAPNN